jgi:hypothetical protein
VIYYDKAGRVQAVGAEAMQDGMVERALDEGWMKAVWCVSTHSVWDNRYHSCVLQVQAVDST